MTDARCIVIVGASLTGAKAAETLRQEGFEGQVLLLGAEPVRPYERPPLSKEYLQGKADTSKVFVHDEAFYDEHDIELRMSTPVRELHLDPREVVLDTGERVAYDSVLVATEGEPRRLTVPGDVLNGVSYLRDLADSDRLRGAILAASRVVVIGAGW